MRYLRRSDNLKLALVLVVALVQGSIFLVLVPPWQHYDEPTHFEYAWLVADRGRMPERRESDRPMRREIAASMLAHDFYRDLGRPILFTDEHRISIGVSELGHPPAYYTLTSLPLRLVHHLDVASQLYTARYVSLLLFLLTVLATAGLVRDLTPEGHVLRWAVPLVTALVPPFADLMTAVNNDVGAVLLVTLFLWISVRVLSFGIGWLRLTGLAAVTILAVVTKNTASITVLLLPLLLLLAVWLHRGWQWRWLVIATVGLGVVAAAILLTWGDAAYWYWYRWGENSFQQQPTRTAADGHAPLGDHALRVEISPEEPRRRLLHPLTHKTAKALAGRPVTVGGWIWADRPATIESPGLIWSRRGTKDMEPVTRPLEVTTEPSFFAWTFQVPEDTGMLNYAVFAARGDDVTQPVTVYLDGALLVEGTFPTEEPPMLDDASGRRGVWGGRSFTNLVRNASAEQGWLRLRPTIETRIISYVRRPPTHLLLPPLDVARTGPLVVGTILPFVVHSAFGRFAWGHVAIEGGGWTALFGAIVLLAALGSLGWLVRTSSTRHRAVAVFLGSAALLLWVGTIVWPLAYLWWAALNLATARYAFPVVAPTVLALVAGWWALWPRRYRRYGILLLVAGFVVLDVVGIVTIWNYYGG